VSKPTLDVILDNCTIVTMDEERRVIRDGAVAVIGSSIEAVGKSAEVRGRFPEARVRDLRGWVVMPGLVDGHVHLPQALLRGSGDEVPLWVWMADRIFILEGAFTAEDARIAARLAVLEMLQSGTTAFLETLILARHHLQELAEVIAETGIRAVLPRAVTDGGGYLAEAPLNPGLDEAPEEAIADALAAAASWRDSDRIRIWFGPRSTGGCSERLIRQLVELARSEGIGLCQHYAMTDRERNYIRSRYGCSQSGFLERVGMLGKDVVLVHCCALEDEDIARLSGTGTSVVHCPTGPAKMGSGVTPVHKLLSAGVNVALGTDAAAANNGADLIRDLKWVGYLQKLAHADPTVTTREAILEMATRGGARATGLDHLIGSIEVGKRADVIVIRTDGVSWTPEFDVISNLVYATTGADVDTVMIDGEVLMEGREMKRLDEERILSDARRAAADLLERTRLEIPTTWPVY
jgi:cytosine/adenosine deaminase-related metal-dependent hydrolase